MSGGEDVYDAGAIRIESTAKGGLAVNGASVKIGPCTYNPWPGLAVSIGTNSSLILTQTSASKSCTSPEEDNFDTSQSFLVSPQGERFVKKETSTCENDGFVPEITLVLEHKTFTFLDTGQVLNRGGIDPDICLGLNEAQEWVQIL
jgi:hypothetical protein